MNPPTFKSSIDSIINNNDNSPPNDSNEPIAKRKRLTQACDACRKKKVKCSGEKPSCNNCTRLGSHCTYLPSTRKRGPRVGLVESLEKRLQQMERLLQPLKEQGIVDIDNMDDAMIENNINNINNNNNNNNNKSGYSAKKPRLNPKDSDSDPPYSNYPRPHQFNPQNAQTNNQFHQVIGNTFNIKNNNNNNDNNNNQSSYSQNNDFNFKSQNQFNDVKSENSGKEEDGLIYFGKTSIKPGFRHHSECHANNTPDSPTISEGSSQSGSVNSEETIPIPNSPTPFPKSAITEFLPQDVIEHLSSCFFRYVDNQMSMFHEATFKKHLRQNKVSPLLVLAMCAVSSRYATHPSIVRKPPYTAGEQFANAAYKLILQSFDYPSVECVQAFILLSLHMFGTCKGPRAWMYIGMAIRMAQEIGLHKIDEASSNGPNQKVKTEANFIQKETRRRTFWSCFLLDRYSACALGRPTLIDEDDCDVRLPCNEAIWNYDHPYSKSLIDGYFNEITIKQDSRITLANHGLCACFVSATVLLGRATQFVNRSKPSNSLPPWDPQSQFYILSNEIEMWYASLSPHYAYNKDRLQKLMANGTGVIFSLLHLIYYATIIVLNRPNIAILQNNEVQDPQQVKFMVASAERCSKSAKIVVSISQDILQHGCERFSPFTIYPLFVSTSILINDCYSSNIAVCQEAERNLEIVDKYLSTMSSYWAMGNKFLSMINEMRKTRAEQDEKKSNDDNIKINSNLLSDAGLLAYWNRAPVENNVNDINDISSIILPEELFVSPRWLGSPNDFTIPNENSWTGFLRAPVAPFSPRSLSRLSLVKRERNQNEENENDYFTQNPLAFNNYPFDGMVDMSFLNQEWPIGKEFLNHRPIKHWSSMNGNTLNAMNEDISNGSSTASST